MRKHRWVWVLIFVLTVVLLGALAAGWNVVFIERMREIEIKKSLPSSGPWIGIVLGSLGFVALLGGMILFFVRLLQEMKLNQLQSEFIAAVTHELKTPLATLELSASLIRAGGLSTTEEGALWNSHGAELSRLKDQVEALLEAAQWQSNAMTARPAPIVLEQWLASSMERWQRILGPTASFRRTGPLLECSALLDTRLLDRIVDNLMDNARKFSKGTPDVTLRSQVVDGRWQLVVQDQGWGFDPSESQRIFKRFVRGKVDAPYAIPGTGLGLYLAQVASKSMKLKISAESSGHGKGAEFTIEGPSL